MKTIINGFTVNQPFSTMPDMVDISYGLFKIRILNEYTYVFFYQNNKKIMVVEYMFFNSDYIVREVNRNILEDSLRQSDFMKLLNFLKYMNIVDRIGLLSIYDYAVNKTILYNPDRYET